MSPRARGVVDSQPVDYVSCATTLARQKDIRLAAAGFRPPFSDIDIYIYICIFFFELKDGIGYISDV